MADFIPLDEIKFDEPPAETGGFIPMEDIKFEKPKAPETESSWTAAANRVKDEFKLPKDRSHIGDGFARARDKAVRDTVVGIATLPLDIAEAFNGASIGGYTISAEKAGEISRNIQQSIPEVKTENDGEKLFATLLQYGVPAAGAYKITAKAVQGMPWAKSYLARIAAVSGSDAAVTAPDTAETIGSQMNIGPTNITPATGNLRRRANVAAESTVLAPAMDFLTSVGRFGKGLVAQFVKPTTNKGAESVAASHMQEAAKAAFDDRRVMDLVAGGMSKDEAEKVARQEALDKAITNLKAVGNRADSPEGYLPTSGTASGNVGLLQVEKGLLGTAPNEANTRFAQRYQSNWTALSDDARRVLASTGNPEDAVRRFAAAHDMPIQEANQILQEVQERAAAAARDVTHDIEDFRYEFGGHSERNAAEASAQLDERVFNELQRSRGIKNRLYESIDPDNTVDIDVQPLRQVWDQITNPRTPTDVTPERLMSEPNARQVLDQLRPYLEAGAGADGEVEAAMRGLNSIGERTVGDAPTLTFGQIERDIKPRLSDAIRYFRGTGQHGDVVNALSQLRNALDGTIDQVIARGDDAAQRARAARDFYELVYAPNFVEGVGGKYRKLEQRNDVVPSGTAAMFVKRNGAGAPESADSLIRIVSGMDAGNRAYAEDAVRNYTMADLAKTLNPENPANAARVIDRFINRHSDFLARFPNLEQELVTTRDRFATGSSRVTDFERDLEMARMHLNDTEDRLNRSIFQAFINEDPVRALSKVFTAKNPGAEMQTLVDSLGGDTRAFKGLRKITEDYVLGKVESKTKELFSSDGNMALLLGKFDNLFADPGARRALEQVYHPEELAALDAVRDSLREMNNINTQVTSTSLTADLQANADKFRTILASYYGIVKGQGIHQITRFIAKSAHADPVENARKVIIKAMLDPELAADLLARNTDEAAVERVRTYVLNNILTVPETDKERERKQMDKLGIRK